MFSVLKPAVLITLVFTVLTGLMYPLAVTGAAQVLFHHQANGSLIEKGGKIIGSELIGQNFTRPEYFHPRPASYDGAASGGSNLGPTNPVLADRLMKDAAAFRKDNPDYTGEIPSDAITTPASGLDPDISPANALAQSARVAKARGMALSDVQRLIAANTHNRALGLIGEPTVNVLRLNLALDPK